MKTSAHEAEPALLTEWSGTLIADAQTRYKPIDAQGHICPVLVMDVRLDNSNHNHLRVEQPFLQSQNAQCQAAARRYRKGTRVTVQAPIVGLRMVAPNLTHVHVHQPEETTP